MMDDEGEFRKYYYGRWLDENKSFLSERNKVMFDSLTKDKSLDQETVYEKKVVYPGILTARAETSLDLQLGWNYDHNRGKEVYVRFENTKNSQVTVYWFPEGERPHWSTFIKEGD